MRGCWPVARSARRSRRRSSHWCRSAPHERRGGPRAPDGDPRRGARQAAGVPAARPPHRAELPRRVRLRCPQPRPPDRHVLLRRADGRRRRPPDVRREHNQLSGVRGRRHRAEQMMGTLESVLTTPTSPATVQLGSVVYDLIYIPIRTGLFLVLAAALFGLDFDASGVGAAAAVLLAFIPFVWGLGIITAAGALTIRGSTAGVGFGVSVLTLVSGAYFPLDL